MPSKKVLKYFDATACRETREELRLAVSIVEESRVAIDCGCGAGSDIAYLRKQGFLVHAFDIEEESILRCESRFKDDEDVLLSLASFSSYNYPDASLIVADSSLFFCPEHEFSEVWCKITSAQLPKGVFVGSFLGPEDTMASAHYDKESYWPEVLVLSEEKVKGLFHNYKIISFTEHRMSGTASDGDPHQWHIFSVVAKKESSAVSRLTSTNGEAG
ncbi:MAG: class I SAM-dependent methyltransferase [Gammaproteobacteria bacterium]|nr:class I SAM-dependent methyltransferase [Gammaproteobacteria bacterium]